MPYSLYLRKSRLDLEAEARGEGDTLARHEKTLLAYFRKLKLPVGKIYREIGTAENIAGRPVMQQVLADVEQGMWEGVGAMEVERLARGDTIDQGIVAQTFKYTDTKIITPVKTYDPNDPYDEEYFEFSLFMSRREYKTITRRLQGGRITSVKEGKFLGSIAPWGYKRKKLEKDKGYTLEKLFPEPDNPINMMFILGTKGEPDAEGIYHRFGISKISRRLNLLQIKPMKGDVWTEEAVRNILGNPVYAGMIRWNFRRRKKRMVDGRIKKERPRADSKDWILVKGLHEPYIDLETFELMQYYLSQNPSRPNPLAMPVKNPLGGLIICGLCGRKMVRRPYTKKELPETLMCPATACKNISSRLYIVEERLIQELENWYKDYKSKWELSDSQATQKDSLINMKKKALQHLDNELKNLEKQSANIHDLLEQGTYTTETFLDRSNILSDRITAAKKDQKVLLEELNLEEVREENQKFIIPKIESVLVQYKSTDDPARKNELLSEIIAKAVYTKTIKSHWRHPTDEFELILYPKLPAIKN